MERSAARKTRLRVLGGPGMAPLTKMAARMASERLVTAMGAA